MQLRMLFAIALGLSACSQAHAVDPDGGPTVPPTADAAVEADGGPPIVADAGTPFVVDAGPPIVREEPLLECLERGGSLREVAVVNNNDVTDHGALMGLAVSPEREIAAAGADGTLKLWTLEGFVGQINTSQLSYGAELGAAPATDVLYYEGRVVIGDTRGLVTSWDVGDGRRVLGGTTPDVAITAVAIDEQTRRLAQADATASVLVRDLEGTGVVGPLETNLTRVTDLAFLSDGRLLLGGEGADGVAALELRDAADPTRVLARFERPAADGVLEVATGDGTIVASVSHAALVFDDALTLLREVPGAADARVALFASGRALFTVDPEGVLRALRTEDGVELARLPTGRAGAVGLRIVPSADLLVAGFGPDATLAAIGCE